MRKMDNTTLSVDDRPCATQRTRDAGALALGALGVVFGDIGTSPLYALRECFRGALGLSMTPVNVLGVLSLILWSLIVVVSGKYLLLILRADNQGEGGILALMSLVTRDREDGSRRKWLLAGLGILGASLLCGDAIVTPAISVLGAIEGLSQVSPQMSPYIVPVTVTVLVLFFMVQRHGTTNIGFAFGPVMLAWFGTIGFLGLISVAGNVAVLKAVNPVHGVMMLAANPVGGFVILGTVFLALTGCEALYADLGHFGRGPIRRGWYLVVLPALVLNYLGQGAILLRPGAHAENLFYQLAPGWFVFPLVVLATLATIVASQAMVTGAFSLARQATQLGLWPRLKILHTSSRQIGQVYVPAVNWMLLVCVIVMVLGFRESGRLASAYGLAVSSDMLITTVLISIVARKLWPKRYLWILMPAFGLFMLMDTLFVASNITKVLTGGWTTLMVAGIVLALVVTWRRGRYLLQCKHEEQTVPIRMFVEDVALTHPTRVSGTAFFLSGTWGVVPRALLHNFKHNHVLHKTTILLTVQTENVPKVEESRRAEVVSHGEGIHSVRLLYGFSEDPCVPTDLERHCGMHFEFNRMRLTYFLGKETLVITGQRGMARWRKQLFAYMSRNAMDPSGFFHLPPPLVVELGLQIEM
jgi:KUP system potassium uptake protein